MGRVAAVYNLMPQDADVSMEDVAKRIPDAVPKGIKIVKVEEKPFAFGLKILEATFLMEDVAGITDNLEASLQKIDGVQTVEPVSVSLI
jgi:translation elongation factor aEF-1 beta